METDAASPRWYRKPPSWAWVLLAAIAAAAAFLGYGQAELMLEAVNLRYCG